MKAAWYERNGTAREVLQVGELPTPQPAAGEVRVRVHWSGVNPSDVKSRAGRPPAFPRIVPHSDGMGRVDAVGPGVDAGRVGQRVWLWNAAWGRADGSAAQYVVLPAAQAVPLPDDAPGLVDEAAACFGIPALTALHAVTLGEGVQARSVLVAGGAGAVGHYAVQMARLAGARQVLATVSGPEKAAIARAAGADVVIDYRREDVAARVREATGGRGVDRVVEVDISANGALDAELVALHGEIVAYGGRHELTLPFFPLISKNVALRFFIVYHLSETERARAIDTLHGWLRAGALEHRIALRLPLERIAEAHEAIEAGQTVGNVVIDLRT